VHSWCGYEDSVVNHILLIKDIAENEYNQDDLVRRTDSSMLSRRAFDVLCVDNIECLELTFYHLDVLKKDFSSFLTEFIKTGI